MIEILHFVHLQEIDPIYYDRAYYLVPEEGSAKAYLLLRNAMEKRGEAAIARIALREKGRLALLRPVEEAIGLSTLYYPESIRKVGSLSKEIPKEIELKPREMEMAVELMKQLSAPFKPESYHDTYREKLMEAIHNKIEGREVAVSKQAEAPLIDLAEALKASLERTREKGKGRRKIA